MLMLSRRIGESIQIGDNITVAVMKLANGQVSLGVIAPKDVPVIRDNAKLRTPRQA